MYKILLVDDEGIVIESLKMIIQKHFNEVCAIESAKTGRIAIEIAEHFRPDIALMDIQIPGINGMDAIEEIKKFSPYTYFVVITAFDQFHYAKRAIDLGVIEFLTKPFNSNKIVDILGKAMKRVDQQRHVREIELKNKEKLEAVVPVIENGFIHSILFQEDYDNQLNNFKELLDIEANNGYIMIIEFGDEIKEKNMTNPTGVTVKAQKFYEELKEIIKEFFSCVIGPIMANKIVVFVPELDLENEYNERVKIIQYTRDMLNKLKTRIDVRFRAGIGSVQSMEKLFISYKEAVRALRSLEGSVVHINDLVLSHHSKQNYITELENHFLTLVQKGNSTAVLAEANHFLGELIDFYGANEVVLKVKLLETIILIKRQVVDTTYYTEEEGLERIFQLQGDEALSGWFQETLSGLVKQVQAVKEECYSESVSTAKQYIDEHFNQDISLDGVSRLVNISAYYFSKVFKDETGENFIDYVTQVRIEKAKQLLMIKEMSIKEVCVAIGYKDPNYFSRLFKKQIGVTPTEYREEL